MPRNQAESHALLEIVPIARGQLVERLGRPQETCNKPRPRLTRKNKMPYLAHAITARLRPLLSAVQVTRNLIRRAAVTVDHPAGIATMPLRQFSRAHASVRPRVFDAGRGRRRRVSGDGSHRPQGHRTSRIPVLTQVCVQSVQVQSSRLIPLCGQRSFTVSSTILVRRVGASGAGL
jgi:hypothetical protein